MNSTAHRLTTAHRNAGLPPPDADWLDRLTKGSTQERYFWRRLTSAYIDLTERITALQRERDALADLRGRVLVAEAALKGGAEASEVAIRLNLRHDQIEAILRDEAVQP